jgi:hypothetical protein
MRTPAKVERRLGSAVTAAAIANPDSCARAREGGVTERLMLVAEDMGAGLWTDVRRRARALEWGVSESTVQNYAAEASRLVRLLQRPHARLRIARALDAGLSVAEDALETGGVGLFCEKCNERCGHKDTSVLGQLPGLADRYAKLTGADEPTRAKHEVTVHAIPPELADAGVDQVQWEALQRKRLHGATQPGDEAHIADINLKGLREALPTFDALPAEERAELRRELLAWCEREGGGE